MASKPELPELVLVSISGAQATGKSTLLSALAQHILRVPVAAVVRTPSFSQRLFERWRARKLPSAPLPVRDFDEIDAKGHREWFQRQLPEALSFEVEFGAQALRGFGMRLNYLLVDRWFPDIMAHTRLGLPKDEITQRQVRQTCRGRHEQIMAELRGSFRVVPVTVFIPVSASTFQVEGQAGKFRATTSREDFETLCLQEWPAILDRQPVLAISSPDLATRVFSIKMAIHTARTNHADNPPTCSPT